jgi:hypothetical protein
MGLFDDLLSRLDGLLGDQHEKQKALGNLLGGSVTPMALKNIAEWTDPIREPYYRKPKTLDDYIKLNLPWLREQVPVAHGK